jgi:N-acetylmuramoyl-L-alanine amidase
VLVEIGFISNPSEEKLMTNAAGDNMFAKGIAKGILEGIKQ